ncbi:MAG: hypothetical protein LC739_12815 [Actinobacteria bacterium]|nr:hypothetical protein [Actinomycetota bacterium]
MPGRSLRPRRPTRSRETTRFIAAAFLSVDLLLTVFSLWDLGPTVRPALVSFLEVWDLSKSALALLALSVIAIRARSPSVGVFAAILGMIAILEGTGAHNAFATWLLVKLGISPNSTSAGAPAYVYAELLVLSGLTVLAAVAIWFSRARERDLSFMRRHLLLILVALWMFAVGVDYLGSQFGSPGWTLLEESGERAVMSVLLGYVLAIRVGRASNPQRRTQKPLATTMN